MQRQLLSRTGALRACDGSRGRRTETRRLRKRKREGREGNRDAEEGVPKGTVPRTDHELGRQVLTALDESMPVC